MKSACVAWLAMLTVTVAAADESRPVDFVHDIAPVLSRFGCNASACHGKAEGQNGFKLSIFGVDPKADFEAMVVQSRGRRIMVAAPDASLLLRKASGEEPHAGGRRFTLASPAYHLLREWIAQGAHYQSERCPDVKTVRVEPGQKLLSFGRHQPLKVLATYADGSEKDVTWLAVFHSNNAGVAEVDDKGEVVTGTVPGKAAVMARYQGQMAVFQAVIPRPGPQVEFADAPGAHAIDKLVNDNLRRMNLKPSGLADDAEYLRRVYLDVIGRLPSAEEARAFLDDHSEGKRSSLVDALLETPDFADYWALRWADLLRVDRQALGARDAYAYYAWIHDAMAANVPLDVFAKQLISAEGPLREQPAGYFFKVTKKSGEMAASLSQVFLGVRITCAECHQHPYDRWTQRDYHGMRAFFEQVSYKKLGEDESLIAEGDPQVRHPRTKELIQPYPLGETMPDHAPVGDRRKSLAAWMTAPDNPWFARNLANRLWAHFLGRGLVEPVDDMRATNPASNPALLDLLSAELVKSHFDAKSLIRFITQSRTYQLSSRPNETNEADEQNFSRALFRRLPAEVLLDAVCDVTQAPEKFDGVPLGYRAVQLWDSQEQHYFLKLFGRPVRATACECERSSGASISQELNLMNSSEIEAKLAQAGGSIEKLAHSSDDAQVTEQLYLSCYSRFPTEAEKGNAMKYLQAHAAHRRQAVEDIGWTLLNSLEFVFNH